MKDPNYEKVLEFMRGMKQPTPAGAIYMQDSDVHAREAWLIEEWREYEEAKTDVDKLDALVDMDYIATGSLITAGRHDDAPYFPVTKFGLDKCALACIFEHRRKPVCVKDFPESVHNLRSLCMSTATAKGYRYQKAFNAVHAANMAKFWGDHNVQLLTQAQRSELVVEKSPAGWIVKRLDGKIVKPPGWLPADLTKFVQGGLDPQP